MFVPIALGSVGSGNVFHESVVSYLPHSLPASQISTEVTATTQRSDVTAPTPPLSVINKIVGLAQESKERCNLFHVNEETDSQGCEAVSKKYLMKFGVGARLKANYIDLGV